MSNAKYLAGRRLEWALVKLGKEHGWSAVRSAGSHGLWDVCWYRPHGVGSVLECLEHLKLSGGWLQYHEWEKVPTPFIYGLYKFTKAKGLTKKFIWVLPVGCETGQVVLIQCKTKKVGK